MKLSQRLDIVVLVLVILYVLTGCTITTDPDDLGALFTMGRYSSNRERVHNASVWGRKSMCIYTLHNFSLYCS